MPNAKSALQMKCRLVASIFGPCGIVVSTTGCQLIAGIGDLSLTGEPAPADTARPVLIASVGEGTQTPTGQAQQTKLIYATASQRWWLFYLDAAEPNLLKTKHSTDFVSWLDGTPLTLANPHGSDGSSFSVAYARISEVDVIHVVISQTVALGERRVYHARATIQGENITFGAPVERSQVTADSPSLDPDGPAVAIGSDDYVSYATSWIQMDFGSGDQYVVRSAASDTGTAWDESWAPEVQLEIVKTAVNAHALVPLADGALLALWEDADVEGTPSNVRWSLGGPGPWSAPPAPVFASPKRQSVNDWTVLARTPQEALAVRRTSDGSSFEQRRFDGLGWNDGPTIAPLASKAGHGVVLAGDGTELALATIDIDNAVRCVRWNGDAWGQWSGAVTLPGERSYLSGWATLVDGQMALLWTEPGPGGSSIMGALAAP